MDKVALPSKPLPGKPLVAFRTVLLSIVGLWTVYFVLASIRWEILGWGFSAEMLWLRAIMVVGGIAVTLLLWLLLRLFEGRSLLAQAVAALVLALPAAILSAQVNQFVFADMNSKFDIYYKDGDGAQHDANADRVNPVSGDDVSEDAAAARASTESDLFTERAPGSRFPEDAEKSFGMLGFLGPLTDIAFSRYFMMLAWCSLYFALVAVSRVRIAERREQEFKSAAKAAELRSLRYQVNPHFLFNTLNSLSALVMTGKADRAERMIQTISRFYRHSLADDPTGVVPLADEFDLQKIYLDIESVRFPERLRCVFDLPEDLRDARVPGMILQPLVENSVKYAVSPVNREVTITVAAREEFDRLVVTVSDNGPGVPEGAERGFGIGLANVRDRLEARFGPDIGLVSGAVPGGYRTEIRIPLTRHG